MPAKFPGRQQPAACSVLRSAATVIILREGAQGPQTFLIQRHGLSDVLGGAHVFPGGKLDDRDLTLANADFLDAPVALLHQQLGEPELPGDKAAALYVAAIREAYEECGVLFAHRASGAPVAPAPAPAQEFHARLTREQLRLETRALRPWSRWITPDMPGLHKRFDARFFVAKAPSGQLAQHDNHEATASAWMTPRQALRCYWNGEIALAPPQILTLAHLSRFPSVEAILNAASQQVPPCIQAQSLEDQCARMLCFPGDVQHPVKLRAMPGPTRLILRNRRYEPLDGFEALFE